MKKEKNCRNSLNKGIRTEQLHSQTSSSNSSLDFKQQLDLFLMCRINSGEIESVAHAIDLNLPFQKIEYVINLIHTLSESQKGLFNLDVWFDICSYGASNELLNKLVDAGYNSYELRAFCNGLNKKLLSINDINFLLNSNFKLSAYDSVLDKIDIICSLIECGYTTKKIISKFKSDRFKTTEMLLLLINCKLNTLQSSYVITHSQAKNLIEELNNHFERNNDLNLKSILKDIVLALDRNYPFELILLIAQLGKFINDDMLKSYESAKLSEKDLSLILCSNHSDLFYKLFTDTNLSYDEILYFYKKCDSLGPKDYLKQIVEYFSKKS